ncbi:MAG TPA: hypothetical protein VJN94_15950, partial [Candidatus Binataceae bacterium]|nr:hypothetical protein [Candidatus Binataceae bacterium]
MKFRLKLALAIAGGLAFLSMGRPSRAQDASTVSSATTLWVDQKTGQVFIRPGRGRVPMNFGSPVDTAKIEQQVEDSTNAKVQAAVAQAQEEQKAKDAELAKKVDEMTPAWKNYVANWQDKFHIGALLFGDYRFYTHTGWQPQELTQLNNPGVGNNNYNSFDITRTYLNFYFFPTKDWTLRITPNMYRTIGSSNDVVGKNTGFGSDLDGNLGVRIKYAYIQYNDLWKDVPIMKGGTVSLGSVANPLVAWEEDLYGYRFVNLTPWNYLSLSSTQVGMSMEGPVKLRGGEKTYLDYGLGVYDNASFHAIEQSDTKQVMGRLTAYPFGADWRYQGLGVTGFYNYGYGNTTPDNMGIVTPLKATNAHIERIAALLHYSQPLWNLATEFDYGQNAFSLGNLFSGSGPADAFGTATGPAISGNTSGDQRLTGAPAKGSQSCTSSTPCYNSFASFGPQTAVYRAILQNGRERNLGFDLFGHLAIPNTKFTLFGMAQWFMPNDNVNHDPLDFVRFIAGI